MADLKHETPDWMSIAEDVLGRLPDGGPERTAIVALALSTAFGRGAIQANLTPLIRELAYQHVRPGSILVITHPKDIPSSAVQRLAEGGAQLREKLSATLGFEPAIMFLPEGWDVVVADIEPAPVVGDNG